MGLIATLSLLTHPVVARNNGDDDVEQISPTPTQPPQSPTPIPHQQPSPTPIAGFGGRSSDSEEEEDKREKPEDKDDMSNEKRSTETVTTQQDSPPPPSNATENSPPTAPPAPAEKIAKKLVTSIVAPMGPLLGIKKEDLYAEKKLPPNTTHSLLGLSGGLFFLGMAFLRPFILSPKNYTPLDPSIIRAEGIATV